MMAHYYMCTLPRGTCIGCSKILFRGSTDQQRSRQRSERSVTITKNISRGIFNDYNIILKHNHSLCSNCISSDVSKWINNVKLSSVQVNRSISSLLLGWQDNFCFFFRFPRTVEKVLEVSIPETEKNGKFSIRIRFDSTRAIFDSILFDLLFKNLKSIRFDSTESTFGFDSIRQEIFSIYSIRFGSLCVRKKMLCILTYFLFFMILSRENESYLSIFSLYICFSCVMMKMMIVHSNLT